MSQLLIDASPASHRRGPRVPAPPPGAAPVSLWTGGSPRLLPPLRLVQVRRQLAGLPSARERIVEDCVIMNPLGRTPLDGTDRTLTSGHGEELPRIFSIISETRLAVSEEEGEEKPIYAELKVPAGGEQQTKGGEEEEEGEVLKNKLRVVEGGRKGVEYWQITTKEMAKFRPCTQIVIRR
jgi:hypothetical protein